MTAVTYYRTWEEFIMENINFGIACDVSTCKHNHNGCNCTLDKIQVGNTCNCDDEYCTCCKSYSDRF